MARERDRFRMLKKELRAGGLTPAAGSRAEGFLKFLTGVNEYKVTNKTPVGSKKRGVVTLLPFNLISSNTTRYAAEITKWSYVKQAGVGLEPTELGYADYNATKDVISDNYYPALIRWRTSIDAPANLPTKTSQITKKSYSFVGAKGGTSPFGCKAAGDAEDVRAKALIQQVKAVTTSFGASYVPEEWRSDSAPVPIANVPAWT